MAKRHGGPRRPSGSQAWMPLLAALLGLLTTISLAWLLAITRAPLGARETVCAPAAAVTNQHALQPGSARGWSHSKDNP